MADTKSSPRIVTSRRRIKYRASGWTVHEFEIWSGELVCRAAALRVEGALLLWVGGAGPARLLELALALAAPGSGAGAGAGAGALATSLLGTGGAAPAMARRLALALGRPVYVCSGAEFDRFTAPLVERGLIAEIKSRPECF